MFRRIKISLFLGRVAGGKNRKVRKVFPNIPWFSIVINVSLIVSQEKHEPKRDD